MLKRIAGSLGVSLLVAAAIAGCGSTARARTGPRPVTSSTRPTTPAPAVSSGAPHLVVCGQLLSAGAAGPVVYDIASRRYPTVTEATVGGVIYVRVSDSCKEGAVVKITPSMAYESIRTVKATDGGVVLVELRPELRQQATLTATLPSSTASEVLRLDVASILPGRVPCSPGDCTVIPKPASGSVAVSHPIVPPAPAASVRSLLAGVR